MNKCDWYTIFNSSYFHYCHFLREDKYYKTCGTVMTHNSIHIHSYTHKYIIIIIVSEASLLRSMTSLCYFISLYIIYSFYFLKYFIAFWSCEGLCPRLAISDIIMPCGNITGSVRLHYTELCVTSAVQHSMQL